MAQVRGHSLPVLDLRSLLGQSPEQAGRRFVSIHLAERAAVLAVDEVLGLRMIPMEGLRGLPPLLAPGSPAVEALAILDRSLLLFLRMAALLPDQGLWR